MDYNLEEIVDQASKDVGTRLLHQTEYQSYMFLGIKINMDIATKQVEILNTFSSGSFYTKLENEDIDLFKKKGWRCAVLELTLSRYIKKLEKIENHIKKYVNEKPSRAVKTLESYHTERATILQKYREITIKLNKINYGNTKKEISL